ncbi:universal stress protein [Streptomyces abyssomicinicus]|uniref:universal stress protein n=1 Tax=Streptomyces abyssomicinicus TaxID=574929 RepID=UPI0012509F9F|nr:universal stress protein [Streptomyces abyssomicinicus]
MADQREQPGRIVVGVDGSEPSREALRWAARQARLTAGVVVAVSAWDVPNYYGSLGWLPPPTGDAAALEERARAELERTVGEVLGTRPPVEVRAEVRHDTAAGALIAASRGADLLVVGNRGLGGFSGLLLGSVSQHCVQHAACPVLVIRHSDTE